MPPRRRQQAHEMPVINERGQADPVQRFVDLLAGAMRSGNPIAVNPNPQANHLANFKDFKTVGPPEFKGTTNPVEAQTWVMEMEKVFEVARVAEEQKTSFATFMLKSDASYWWQANKCRGGTGVILWERFKEMFFEMYFPLSMQNKMEVQFLELKQGIMTVPEYASKFNELARFASYQVNTDERKARRFEQGLDPELYRQVSIFQINSFATILEKAIIAEGGNEALTKYHQDQKEKGDENKGNNTSGSGENKRKGNGNNFGSKPGNGKKRIEACSTCGKSHSGVCLKGKRVCFNCGQEGHIAPNCYSPRTSGCYTCGAKDHMARNCPKKLNLGGSGNMGNNNSGKLAIAEPVSSYRPTARTFNMTVQDAMESKGIVSGILKFNINICILIGLNIIYSFLVNEITALELLSIRR